MMNINDVEINITNVEIYSSESCSDACSNHFNDNIISYNQNNTIHLYIKADAQHKDAQLETGFLPGLKLSAMCLMFI